MLLRSYGITPECVSGDGPGRTVVPLFHPVGATAVAAGDTVITLGLGASDTSVPAWRPGLTPGHGALLAVAALFDAGHAIRRRYIPGRPTNLVSLPPYDWAPDLFWVQNNDRPAEQRRPVATLGLRDFVNLVQPGRGAPAPNSIVLSPPEPPNRPLPADVRSLLAISAVRGAARGSSLRNRGPSAGEG